MNVASAMVSGAELKLRCPVPSLRPYLGCFWALETTITSRLRSLPDACAALSVELSENASTQCFLSGPRLTPTERMPEVGKSFFGVRLLPGVAFVMTGTPIYRVADRRLPLTILLPDAAPRLEQELAQTRAVEERFNVLEEFLLRRLVGTQIDPRVQRALTRIEESDGQVRVVQLARECQMSCRHLNRLLRTWVGLSPKRLARVMRFQGLLQRLEMPVPGSPARVAADLGYFDQAHLTNEVAQLAGSSPGRIAKYGVADFSKTRCE